MQAMVDIDTSGAEVLNQVLSRLADSGVTVVISRANEPTTALLEQYRLLDLIGENRLYPTNRHAIAAYRQEHEQPDPGSERRNSQNEGDNL
jgi:anti-anti-sigma regulatory factor